MQTQTPPEEFKYPCFYVPGENCCIDTAELRDGVWRSTIHNEDLAQIRLRHPEAQLGDFEIIHAQAEESCKTIPVEITEKEFLYALSVLPPVGWRTARGVESFKISERFYGNVTAIYARLGERYFTFSDLITLSADEIADRINDSAAFKRDPMQFMTLEEFRALNSSSYDHGTSDHLYALDFEVLTKRIQKLNQHEGPRVGDFVRMPDNSLLRLASEYPDEPRDIQTAPISNIGNSAVYINRSGICEYSGSLNDGFPRQALTETTTTTVGRVWFFSTDQPTTRLYANVSFRVYEYQPTQT